MILDANLHIKNLNTLLKKPTNHPKYNANSHAGQNHANSVSI